MIWTIYSMVIGTVIAIVWPGPWEILQLNPKIKNTHSSSYLEGFFSAFFFFWDIDKPSLQCHGTRWHLQKNPPKNSTVMSLSTNHDLVNQDNLQTVSSVL